MPAGFHFRTARAADFRALHAACFASESPASFGDAFRRALKWQQHGHCYWLVAETDATDNLIGCGQLLLYPYCAEIARLSVAPPYQGKGIGTAMLRQLIDIARSSGLPHVEIGIARENTRAQGLYQRLGFLIQRNLQLPGMTPSVILRKKL
ncbi:MAG: GNAT family N-acetyltransferase [Anaerolineae bacterium]